MHRERRRTTPGTPRGERGFDAPCFLAAPIVRPAMTEDGWSGSIANRFHLVARSPLALSDPLLLWQIMWLFFHAQRGFWQHPLG